MKKKGFKAPSLSAPHMKDAGADTERQIVNIKAKEKKKDTKSKKSKKLEKRNKEINCDSAFLENNTTGQNYENKEEGLSATSQKLKKETAKHLTDSEYEELFASVLSLTCTGSTQKFDLNDEKEVKASEKDVDSSEEDPEPENPGGGEDIDMIEIPDDMRRDTIRCNNEVTPQVSDCEGPVAPPRLEHSKKKLFVKKKKMVPRQLIFPDPMEKGGNGESYASPVIGSKDSSIKAKSTGSQKKKLKNRKLDKFGTWVQCTNRGCLKWRYLDYIMDPIQLPEKWDCSMNKDVKYSNCSSNEQHYSQEEHEKHFYFKKYTEGSLVWAKMDGFPWWPGMVEIDPDEDEYFECKSLDHRTATHYHVVFFDEKVSRSWMQEAKVKPFNGLKDSEQYEPFKARGRDYSKKVSKALDEAMKAYSMSLQERICHYGFGNRFKGRIAPVVKGDDKCTTKGKKKKHLDGSTEIDFVLENAEEIIESADSILKDFFENRGSKKQKSTKSTKGRDNIDKSKAPVLPFQLYKKPMLNKVVKAVKPPKTSGKGTQLENTECIEKAPTLNEKENTHVERSMNFGEVPKSPALSEKEDEKTMGIEMNKNTSVEPVQKLEKKDVISGKKKKRKGKKDHIKSVAIDVEISPITTTREKELGTCPAKGKKRTKTDHEKLSHNSKGLKNEIETNQVAIESSIKKEGEGMKKSPQMKKTAKRRLFMPNDISEKKAKKFLAPIVSLNKEQKNSKQNCEDMSECNLMATTMAKKKMNLDGTSECTSKKTGRNLLECKDKKDCEAINLSTTDSKESDKGLNEDIKDNDSGSCSNSQPFEYEETERESKDSIDLENEVSTSVMDTNADSDFDFEE